MPDDRFDPAGMERFHAAVDRLASGVPAPLLDDPELQELLDLAGRLRHDLEPGLPDPAFRASLKHQLTTPVPPGIVSLPERAASRSRAARFPYVAAFGSLAVVFLAVIAVGAFVVMRDDDTAAPAGLAGASVAETETAISAAFVVASPTEDSSAADAPPTTAFESSRVEPTPTPSLEAPTATSQRAAATPTNQQATPTIVATLIATIEPTPEPTTDRGLAMVLPPVNSTTVESGPVPAADPGAGGAITTMSYVLATDLPEIAPVAPAYMLAPPQDDPVALVRQIAAALGIEGEVGVNQDFGKMDYHIGDETGRTFHWYPETGAFKFSSPGDDPGMEMSSDEVVENCRGWLTTVGYPVHDLTASMYTQPVENTGWLVESAMEAMPRLGYGHPLGVRMLTDSEGKVVDASGYWLEPLHQADVTMISAVDAWEALTSHQGYWFGAGGAYVEGGELRVEAIEVSYVLTSSPDGLILQPVIAMRGEFRHNDGHSSGVTVFIQAGRSMAWYYGP